MLVFEHLGLHLWHVWHILCLHVVVQSEFQLKPGVRDCQNKATNQVEYCYSGRMKTNTQIQRKLKKYTNTQIQVNY